MANTSKPITFQVDEAFKAKLRDEQWKALRVFMAANPQAYIERIPEVLGEGAVPAYLVKQSGNRHAICLLFSMGRMLASAFVTQAKEVGKGGIEDLRANLIGSYSKRDGKGVIRLVAS